MADTKRYGVDISGNTVTVENKSSLVPHKEQKSLDLHDCPGGGRAVEIDQR